MCVSVCVCVFVFLCLCACVCIAKLPVRRNVEGDSGLLEGCGQAYTPGTAWRSEGNKEEAGMEEGGPIIGFFSSLASWDEDGSC